MKTKLVLSFSMLGLIGFGCQTLAAELNSSNVESVCFSYYTELYCNSVSIGGQAMTSIAPNTFINYPTITSLSLDGNQLSGIVPGAFNGLNSLTTLSLNYNQIRSIVPGAFNGLTSLTSLYFQGNLINSIESLNLNGLTSLTNLGLDYNQISSIAPGVFNGLTSLTTLGLSYNQISSIVPNTFINYSTITSLYLAGNQLSSIEPGAFNGLTSLTTLGLSSNQISSIVPGVFNGLSSLVTLLLFENQISSIEAGIFNGLTSLSTLHLHRNQISSIDISAFNGLTLGDLTIWRICNNNPITNVSNLNKSSDGNNCSILAGTTQAAYISALTSKSYVLNAGSYLGDKTISFYKGVTNTIGFNTTMKYVKPDGYASNTSYYYNDANTKIFYPQGTVLTRSGNMYTGNLTAPILFETGGVSSYLDTVYSVVRFGDLVRELDFSQDVTVTMPAPGLAIGETTNIYTSTSKTVYGQAADPRTLHQEAAVVQDIGGSPYVVFPTNHASRYALAKGKIGGGPVTIINCFSPIGVSYLGDICYGIQASTLRNSLGQVIPFSSIIHKAAIKFDVTLKNLATSTGRVDTISTRLGKFSIKKNMASEAIVTMPDMQAKVFIRQRFEEIANNL